MSIIRIDDFKTQDLGRMISQYYLKHGKCHYIQVDDCIFQLDKDKNAFGLEGLPLFKD